MTDLVLCIPAQKMVFMTARCPVGVQRNGGLGVNDQRTLVCMVMGLLIWTGCGGASPDVEEPNLPDSSGGDTSIYEGAITSTDVERGKGIFDDFCGDCHPDGQDDVGPSLIADPHTPSAIRQQIREGSGRMRPFSEKRLSADDMEAVLAWLASVNAVK